MLLRPVCFRLVLVLALTASASCGDDETSGSSDTGVSPGTEVGSSSDDTGLDGSSSDDAGLDGSSSDDTGLDTDSVGGPDVSSTNDVLPDLDRTWLEPETAGLGAADLQMQIHTGQDVHAISAYIYGTNQPDWERDADVMSLIRLGGNRWTAYNWETNASNAGSDWQHQNDGFLGGGDTPGGAVQDRVEAAHANGAAALITVPIAGYVAADKDGGGDVSGTADYLNARFHVSLPMKEDALSLAPDTGDGVVYQDEFVNWVEQTFAGEVFYSLDNEPDLWDDTHARIRESDLTYAELVQRNIDYGLAIRRSAPEARIFGPVNYGWQGTVDLQEASDAGEHGNFLAHYLAQMRQAEVDHGQRLLDVLDIHWYPEARGGGTRITSDSASSEIVAARVQAGRSLWDPNYTEDSWISMWGTQGPIRLLPRLRDLIATHYPGTEMAITEYYYGGGDDISGGIAQADVLGVYGREDVFAANLWHIGQTDDTFIHGAFAMYRNFDGLGGQFGDTSAHAATDDDAVSAVYASVDGDRVVVVTINRSGAAQSVGLAVTHWAELQVIGAWQLTGAAATPVSVAVPTSPGRNAFLAELPAMSVTTLVLTPR